jgi:hypothetical protein
MLKTAMQTIQEHEAAAVSARLDLVSKMELLLSNAIVSALELGGLDTIFIKERFRAPIKVLTKNLTEECFSILSGVNFLDD